MNLPFLKKQESEKNFFLSLLIAPYKVAAILFEEVSGKLFILANNETVVESDIDQISADELLMASDRAISAVEPSLPADTTVEKTIFSLPYDWIVDAKIKDVHLAKLKNVCKSLGLTPIGYLTSIEAIVHFIDKNEGAPVSAIFFEITKNRVFGFLVRAGKIIADSSETVSEDVLATSETILRKLMNSVDVLPAKIILLDLENSEKLQQEFLSHKWPASISFLHVPQVTVLEKGFENEAIVNGVATQMELNVETDAKKVAESVPVEEALSEADSSDFGFVQDDIAKVGEKTEAEVVEPIERDEGTNDLNSDNLENVDLNVPKESVQSSTPDVNYFKENDNVVGVDDNLSTDSKPKLALPVSLGLIMAKLKQIKMPSQLPKVPNFGGSFKNKIGLIIGAVVIFIILFSFIYYNFILHAQVIVFEDKKAVDKTSDITFSKEASASSIKMDTATEEVKGDENKNATGKQETGDKAKGSVTIYNKSENSQTFSKGTTVIGPNNLEFLLTDDVKVASTSSFSTSLSSANAKIEASKFGKEYNLPSDSNFTIKGVSISDAIAKNSDATSGGSSKTTTVVSAEDLSKLLDLVTQKLQSDALAKAQNEISATQALLPQALSSEVKEKKYTQKEGAAVANVGLSATIDYVIGKYEKAELDNFVKNLSKNEVPGTYVLQKGDSKITVTSVKPSKDGDSASATLKINAIYTPQIDSAALAKSLGGKSQGSSVEKIKAINGVSDVTILFTRKIPLFPTLLPFNSKNIIVEIKH